MNDKIYTCDLQSKNINTIDPDEYIYIEDIIEKKINILDSDTLLQYIYIVSQFIKIFLEKSYYDNFLCTDDNVFMEKIQNIIECLHWMSMTCSELAGRINQKIIDYIPNHKNNILSISRSSYNFCEKYIQCENFYNKNSIPTCKNHHYVYPLLKYDIESIKICLKSINNSYFETFTKFYNELMISINTICFVSRHMAKELKCSKKIDNVCPNFFHRDNPYSEYRRLSINDNRDNHNKNNNKFQKKKKIQKLYNHSPYKFTQIHQYNHFSGLSNNKKCY